MRGRVTSFGMLGVTWSIWVLLHKFCVAYISSFNTNIITHVDVWMYYFFNIIENLNWLIKNSLVVVDKIFNVFCFKGWKVLALFRSFCLPG